MRGGLKPSSAAWFLQGLSWAPVGLQLPFGKGVPAGPAPHSHLNLDPLMVTVLMRCDRGLFWCSSNKEACVILHGAQGHPTIKGFNTPPPVMSEEPASLRHTGDAPWGLSKVRCFLKAPCLGTSVGTLELPRAAVQGPSPGPWRRGQEDGAMWIPHGRGWRSKGKVSPGSLCTVHARNHGNHSQPHTLPCHWGNGSGQAQVKTWY
jgi:hypothetical protein